ncbi:hypothetical protein P3S38_29450, partial [Enterobacter hormaechei]|uniref:hypothetical protein n=1 Tax=Enterobacter hormaechei TaxID=158836 RepID=UPI0023E454E5
APSKVLIDQATTYTTEFIDNTNDLDIVVTSKDDTSIKVIKNSVVTSNVEPIENQEKNSTLMLSKDPCQDQSFPSSCSNTPWSLQLSTLSKSSQASSTPIKKVSPIQDVHDPIENPNAHSKDVDIPSHYPFASSKSILGPYPSNL